MTDLEIGDIFLSGAIAIIIWLIFSFVGAAYESNKEKIKYAWFLGMIAIESLMLSYILIHP